MKKELIVIIACLLAIVGIVFLLILPALDSAGQFVENLSSEKQKLTEAQANVAWMQKLNAQKEQIDQCASTTQEILPTETKEYHPNLATLLDKIAFSNNLKSKSIKFSEKEKETAVSKSAPVRSETTDFFGQQKPAALPVVTNSGPAPASQYKIVQADLELSGTLDNFKKYLLDIENAVKNHSRIIDVVSISYSTKQTSEGSDIGSATSFRLSMYIYYQ